jgi:hypothetical protein
MAVDKPCGKFGKVVKKPWVITITEEHKTVKQNTDNNSDSRSLQTSKT